MLFLLLLSALVRIADPEDDQQSAPLRVACCSLVRSAETLVFECLNLHSCLNRANISHSKICEDASCQVNSEQIACSISCCNFVLHFSAGHVSHSRSRVVFSVFSKINVEVLLQRSSAWLMKFLLKACLSQVWELAEYIRTHKAHGRGPSRQGNVTQFPAGIRCCIPLPSFIHHSHCAYFVWISCFRLTQAESYLTRERFPPYTFPFCTHGMTAFSLTVY